MAATTNFIGQVLLGGSNYVIGSTAYYVCSTEAATAAKTITDVDFTLMEGQTIHVKFANLNTAANPTLAINGGASKPIHIVAGTAAGITPETSWSANAVISLTYDGTAWVMNDFPAWANDLIKKNDAMVYMGTYTATSTQTIDPSAFSVYPTINPTTATEAKGWTFKVIANPAQGDVYFGTQKVESGDMIIINGDDPVSTTRAQGEYDIIQNNLDIDALDHTHTVIAEGVISSDNTVGTGNGNYTPEGTISTPTITVTESDTWLSATATQGTVTTTDTHVLASATATQGTVTESDTYLSATATQGAVTTTDTYVLASATATQGTVTESDTYLSASATATQGAVTPTDADFFNSASVTNGVLSFGTGSALTAVSVANPTVSVTIGTDASTGDVQVLTGVSVADPTVAVTLSTDSTSGDITMLTGVSVADPTVAIGTDASTGDVHVLTGVTVADPTVQVTLSTDASTGDITMLTGVSVADPTVTIDTDASTGDVHVLTGVTVADPTVQVTLSTDNTSGDITMLTGVSVADPTVTIGTDASTGDVQVLTGATAALDAAPTFTGTETELTFTGSQVTTSGWSL